MQSDTTEKGLETIIVESLINDAGYIQSYNEDFDPEYALDWKQLSSFLSITQKKMFKDLGLDEEGMQRTKFLHRLQDEIENRGVIDVLRRGISHNRYDKNRIKLFYASASEKNIEARARYNKNIFSVTRQLHYSKKEKQLSLDMVIFINGLPIATFELKNTLTQQTYEDAIQQYKHARNPEELLFKFGRCAVHFAVDDHEVWMCTRLEGKQSWFLPFNKGYSDGAGNPPNPHGIATDYLWKQILDKKSLSNIIENYAQIITVKKDINNSKRKQIFPRYHQLDVVRKLLSNIPKSTIGKRYLIQHSAGSGKSNSIAWLAHQLIDLKKKGKTLFDSILVITDRKALDKQIRNTIKQFAQISSTVGSAERSADLRKFLKSGKKIIITTVQKFPYVLKEIGDEHRANKFAIIIDEAHSGQGGKVSSQMNSVLAENKMEYGADSEITIEDKVNQLMESKKMISNADYFAFTATPKNKTLEIFGEPFTVGDTVKHRPFHSYTMKQAIQEGFILDVLKHYTPVDTYYRLVKTIEGDPVYDTRKAQKKLRKYVESHEHAIKTKAEIMVDHFHEQVAGSHKIGGQARAMIVTNGIEQAVQYYRAVNNYLKELRSPYQAIVAFSGEHEFNGIRVTEMKLNGFPSNSIPEKFKKDTYRFLIVADKFQTGYDEPLLHTMYVDKTLTNIKAVQTLSRLNRAHPKKYDTFVLDFCNDTKTIENAFAPYYRTTLLSEETDPNKLHDLKATLDAYQVYAWNQVVAFGVKYLNDAERTELDPILDGCVAIYESELDEDDQVDFKGKAKVFVRTYGFLCAILPYQNTVWEQLSIFLNFLIHKLPAPKEDDLSRGILETIDMESYRAEVKLTVNIDLPDDDAEIKPIPTSGGGMKAECKLDALSQIIDEFNDFFGNIDWKDKDKIHEIITKEIPSKVAEDEKYKNAMKNSDKENAKIQHDAALNKVILDKLHDQTELFKQFEDNRGFKKWLEEKIFKQTYNVAQ